MRNRAEFMPWAILIIFFGLLYLWGINTLPLTDPDETFYSETAREMMNHHSFFTPLIFEKPQFEKPPLFYWLLILSFQLFGVNTPAARLPSAIFGVLGLVGSYIFLRKILVKETAFYASLIMGTILLYFGMARVALIDLVFSVCVAFSLYSFFLWYISKKGLYMVLFPLFSSLAVLAKGPLGIIIPLGSSTLFLICIRDLRSLKAFLLGKWWFIFILISSPWYIYAITKYGSKFWGEFIIHDNWHRFLYAEHKNLDRWYFYPAVILGGSLPWTGYFLLWGRNFHKYRKEYLFLFSWVLSVFFMFTLAHSKLTSYILPLFPAVSIITAISLFDIDKTSQRLIPVGIFNVASGLLLLLGLKFLKIKYPGLFLPAIISFFPLSFSLILSGILIVHGKLKKSLLLNSAGFLLFVCLSMLTIVPELKYAFSDKNLTEVIRKYNYYNKPVLCNKMYGRGIYFWTHNPVVVIDTSKNPFWSPQPVRILSGDREIINFFKRRNEVLCVVKNGDLKRIRRLVSKTRVIDVISRNFDKLIVLVKKGNLKETSND